MDTAKLALPCLNLDYMFAVIALWAEKLKKKEVKVDYVIDS